MPYTIEVSCLCCGKTAHGVDEIESLFVWRISNNNKIPQSYCREYRTAHCTAREPCKVKK